MKKLNQRQQKAALIGFCIVFITALLFAIRYNKITIGPMYIPAHIGRTLTDPIILKK